MTLQLESHFVAFIDLLGFSEMVRADCESSGPPNNLRVLYKAHTRASSQFATDLQSGLIQFSDSIVFSRPFNLPGLEAFISSIAEWQRLLLSDGLLCRGGVTFGKHFVKDRFMFSKGLIDAYHLESSQAKYPRIVVSENLLQLATSAIDIKTLRVIREEDGVAFVDYLSSGSPEDREQMIEEVRKLITNTSAGDASVQEKLRWLARYTDHKLGSNFVWPQIPGCIGSLPFWNARFTVSAAQVHLSAALDGMSAEPQRCAEQSMMPLSASNPWFHQDSREPLASALEQKWVNRYG